MIIAALWFLAGAGLNAGAQELWMLVLGERQLPTWPALSWRRQQLIH